MTENITFNNPILIEILQKIEEKGYESIVIGGCVRDKFMEIDPKDIDIEVHGCTIDQLNDILSKMGKVDTVGKAFGILKFKKNNVEFDFSVPRKENRIGIGHKGFEVILETMTKEEAALRRDFTFNALGFNPLTNTLYDFFNGLEDLKNGIIRHTSDKFKEDSLRILRGLQFQSRMGFEIAPETFEIMREMSSELFDLPKERLSEEFMKWAIKGKHPEMIFDFLRNSGAMSLIPELGLLKETEQDIFWHPEGNAETHTAWVLKRMLDICERENINGDNRAVFIFAALFHDIAKPQTTEKIFNEKLQRFCVTSHRHDIEGAKMTEDILNRIGIKPVIIEKVVKLVKFHLAHTSLFSIDNLKSKKSALLKLSKNLHPATISDVLLLIEADSLGRGDIDEKKITDIKNKNNEMKELADSLHISTNQRKSILMGRHLIEIGMKPNAKFGEILRAADEAQDNMEFVNLKGAKLWLNYKLKPSFKNKVLLLWFNFFYSNK